MKPWLTRCVITFVLLSNTACARQAEDARRDYILGGDHGWIDLALLPAATATKGACALALSLNGESVLAISLPAGKPGATAGALGYRLPVPVGKLDAELVRSGCGQPDMTVDVPLDMTKDHLARLEYDGAKLAVTSMAPFEPATLERVRSEVQKLQAENERSTQAMGQLTIIGLGILAANTLLLLLALFAWFRRQPRAI